MTTIKTEEAINRDRRRLLGTAAIVGWCAANGAGILRVHDVEPMCKVVRVVRAIVDVA